MADVPTTTDSAALSTQNADTEATVADSLPGDDDAILALEGEADYLVDGEGLVEDALPSDGDDGSHAGDVSVADDEGTAEAAGDAAEARFDAAVGFGGGHGTDPVYSVDVDANGIFVASGGGDDVCVVWEAASGEILHRLTGHTDSVVAVRFSATDGLLATGGLDGRVFVWDVASGEQVAALEGPEEVEFLVWHPKGLVLVAGGVDGMVWMWHLPSGNVMQVFAGHTECVSHGSFSSDGKLLVTVSHDMSLIVWDPKTGQPKQKIYGFPFHDAPINVVAIHGDHALTGAMDGTVCLTHIATGRVLHTWEGIPPPAEDGQGLEQDQADGEPADGEPADGEPADGEPEEAPRVRQPPADTHRMSVESLGFCASSTHPWLASADLDGVVIIRDTTTGNIRHHLVHDGGVVRMAWHPRLPLLYTLCIDGGLRTWDARTGENTDEKFGHADVPLDMALAAGGELNTFAGETVVIATGGDDACAYLWVMQTQQEVL